MNKKSIYKIVKLVDDYAKYNIISKSTRAWALYSLLSLGFSSPKEDFLEDLSAFLNLQLSIQDLDAWLSVNPNFGIIDREWVVDMYGRTSYLQSSDNEKPFFRRIYKAPVSQTDTEAIKIKDSLILNKTDKIPALYYYKVELTPISILENIDKKYSKYLFLIPALEKISHFSFKKMDIENFHEFINSNANRLNGIFNFINKAPTVLGSGGDGVAYDIGHDYILKIFSDLTAYNDAIKSIKILHSNSKMARTEAMIYDVGSLGTFNEVPINYLIMEKFTPVTTLSVQNVNIMKSIIQYIVQQIYFNQDKFEHIRDIFNWTPDSSDPNYDETKNAINEQNAKNEAFKQLNPLVDNITNTISKDMDMEIASFQEAALLKNEWLKSLVEEMAMKFLSKRVDFNIGNIGITKNRQLRFFDPSHSVTTTSINYTGFNPRDKVNQEAKTV